MHQLLKELDIPVYYASEYGDGSGRDAYSYNKNCKRNAMCKFLSDVYGNEGICSDLNVLSIGDAEFEQEAVREVVRDWDQTPVVAHSPLCKTVRLKEQPFLQQLRDELQLLRGWLPSMVSHTESFSFCMGQSLDLQRRTWTQTPVRPQEPFSPKISGYCRSDP